MSILTGDNKCLEIQFSQFFAKQFQPICCIDPIEKVLLQQVGSVPLYPNIAAVDLLFRGRFKISGCSIN